MQYFGNTSCHYQARKSLFREFNLNPYPGLKNIVFDLIFDKNLFNLKKDLINNNHSPLIINNNSYINYNYRLFLINDIKLLNKFKKNSYNIIIIY